MILRRAIDEVGEEDFGELSVAHTIVDGKLVYSADGDLRDRVLNFEGDHANRIGR